MSSIRLTEKPIITNLPPTGKLSIAVDESDGQLYTIDSAGVVTKYFPPTSDNCRIGFFDYNDAATAITPIQVPSNLTNVDLTNDGLGAFTNKTYAPVGVSDVWDASTNLFDFTDLSLGDMVDIRFDATVTTNSNNQLVEVDLLLGIGGSSYAVPFASLIYKTAGTQVNLNVYNGVYMGDNNTLLNGAKFQIRSDGNASVVVNGWYCKVLIRG